MSTSLFTDIKASNPAYQAIKNMLDFRLSEGALYAAKNKLMLVNAKSFLDGITAGRVEQLLTQGNGILLFDLDEGDHQALASHTGFVIPGKSVATYISASKNVSGKLDYTFYNMPDLSCIYDRVETTLEVGEGSIKDAKPPKKNTEKEERSSLTEATATEGYRDFFISQFCGAILTIS